MDDIFLLTLMIHGHHSNTKTQMDSFTVFDYVHKSCDCLQEIDILLGAGS